MTLELVVWRTLVALMFVLAAVVFVALFFKTAPYDRHNKKDLKGWGPQVDNRLGWMIMEVPASVVFLSLFAVGQHKTAPGVVFCVMYNVHYVYRGFVFPFQLRGKTTMPLTIASFGATFNLANAYLNARWFYTLRPEPYPVSWVTSWQFLVGFVVFYAGVAINLHSDHVTRNLRAPGDQEMRWVVPQKGLHKYVAAPNYLGEITEWCGWALLTFSLPGLVFAVWTFANLAPRANSHWKWYRAKFGDEYPANRKRLIPFVW
ncbi:MAG: DUF1295 domain-containing protein [Promethearchaeota archaeon]